MATFTADNDESRSRRELWSAVLVVALSLVMAALPPGPQQRIAAALRASVLRPVIFVQESVALARVRSAQSAELQARVDSLVEVLSTRAVLAEENQRLRELLDLAERLGPSYRSASALRPGTRGSESMFVLDVGADAGVREGSPIVVKEGLVGVVREVRAGLAIAMDWTHPDFRASAMTLEGETYGIVEPRRGEFREEDRLLLTGVAFYTGLEEGARIVTSGLGGVYPRGIPLGRVEELAESEGRWRKSYWIRPAVQPGSVTHVLVSVAPDQTAVPAGVGDLWPVPESDSLQPPGPAGDRGGRAREPGD